MTNEKFSCPVMIALYPHRQMQRNNQHVPIPKFTIVQMIHVS